VTAAAKPSLRPPANWMWLARQFWLGLFLTWAVRAMW
jgi:hypothetical protein